MALEEEPSTPNTIDTGPPASWRDTAEDDTFSKEGIPKPIQDQDSGVFHVPDCKETPFTVSLSSEFRYYTHQEIKSLLLQALYFWHHEKSDRSKDLQQFNVPPERLKKFLKNCCTRFIIFLPDA